MNAVKNLSLLFAAGSFGGLANALAVWLAGYSGMTAALGVKIAPALTPPFVYQKIVWGGIWGLIFLIPLLVGRPLLRGLIFSLGPTLVQLCVVFPHLLHKGIMGTDLGRYTFVVVILANMVWGIAASYWESQGRERSRKFLKI